jgi:cyclopropane-fatty-acyl-phospholipid synthase
MTTQLTAPPSTDASRTLLRDLIRPCQPFDFAVRFWDGTTWEPKPGQPAAFTLVLQHPGALRQMFWRPSSLGLGEAYIYDDFDVEGDMIAFIAFLRRLEAGRRGLGEKLRLGFGLYRLPALSRPRPGNRAVRLDGDQHSPERDRQAIGYHYDVSNDFFALWLDRRMVYSCAYFHQADDDLDTAQQQKLDHICRKLRLRPGERLLDLGCGWGGLILHAAQNYGVEAVGVTLSRQQAELARERIRQAGLEDRCRVEYRDYRELNDAERFDKAASVGVLEHIGEAKMPTFFHTAYRMLRPGGVFFNQCITLTHGAPVVRHKAFNQNYVFPDGELRPLDTVLRHAEQAGFEIRDVEGLREHYALTLGHWLRRLEAGHEAAVRRTDEPTYRIFRLYLARAAYGFRIRDFNLYQQLLVKSEHDEVRLPLTRADWYK